MTAPQERAAASLASFDLGRLSEQFGAMAESFERDGKDPQQAATLSLTQMCLLHGLPILTPQQGDAARGTNPTYLGKGFFGSAFLNREEALVVKVTSDAASIVLEAKALTLLKGEPRV